MSRHRRKQQEIKAAVLARREGAPILSDRTMQRILELRSQVAPGVVNHVGIFHEQFCADALRAGAPRCMCVPDVHILDPNNPRDRRMLGLEE